MSDPEAKRTRVSDSSSIDWTECSRSALCRYLLTMNKAPSSLDLTRARDLLASAANDIRTSKPLVHEPLSLTEVLWTWVLVHQPTVPYLPAAVAVSSASTSSATSAAASSRLDSACSFMDRVLPFDKTFASLSDFVCSEHKDCKESLRKLLTRLSMFLRCCHTLGSNIDFFSLASADWALLEKDISDWVRAHADPRAFLRETAEEKKKREDEKRPPTVYFSNIPPRLARLSLQAYQECSALNMIFSRASMVSSFTNLELKESVFQKRQSQAACAVKEMALRFIALDVDEVFGRRYCRFLCRLTYPAGATQSYCMNNRESTAPRPDESVTILQRGLVRLGIEDEKVFELVDHFKKISTLDRMRTDVRNGEPLLLTFIFSHLFQEETKINFIENFCFLPEHVCGSVEQSRLLSSTRTGRFKCLPTVAAFAGKASLWYQGQCIDMKKSLLDALAGWIVYVRDVFLGDLEQFTQNHVYRQFFAKRFPL